MVNKNIGRRVRKYRKLAGMNQEDLAEKTSLSVIAISNIERGVNYPSFHHFIAIANALNISADALLVDVINNSYEQEANALSVMLADVEPTKRIQILTIIKTLLEQP